MLKQFVCTLVITVGVAQFGATYVANSVQSNIVPYTLYDQALQKLGELRIIVDSAIASAKTNLNSASTAHHKYADESLSAAEVKLQDEADKINGAITDMQNMANSAGVNIRSCLRLTQPQLDRALLNSQHGLATCVSDANKEVDTNIDQAKKEVGDATNNVDELLIQIKACTTGSILCLSPVIRQIDVDKVELPEVIESEVHKAVVLVDTLTPKVDHCSDSNVSTYVTAATSILQTIEDCVNSIV
ncbi:uncharacterized protein LOC123007103 [Tribolium madens]|uniref:uncharacterized protein LOC123007103 n=1 Tax=Tribolium madens TaxID=41895 RepID=UPI001CF7422B|nr:uncharacterized protein LOC123007103 [Tribolium madens]